MLNLLFSFGVSLMSLVSFQAASPKAETAKAKLPNIVLIFMDDMGYGDVGCFGATQYNTPNIDRLAAEGIRFTNFYMSQAVCSASRTGLLTGCYSNRVGVSGPLEPNSSLGINPDEELIPELLLSRGYKNAIVGKWHLCDRYPFLPLQNGFQEYFGIPYSNDMWPADYDGKPATKNKDSGKLKVSASSIDQEQASIKLKL